MKFFYCEAGPDGNPVLMIGPKLEDGAIRDLQHGAGGKSASGEVIPTPRGLLFQVDPGVRAELEHDLKHYFSRKVAALEAARVVSADDEDLLAV